MNWAEALPILEEQIDKLVTYYGVRRRIMQVLSVDLVAQRSDGIPETGRSKQEFKIWVRFAGREWRFDSKTGQLLGAGTFLG